MLDRLRYYFGSFVLSVTLEFDEERKLRLVINTSSPSHIEGDAIETLDQDKDQKSINGKRMLTSLASPSKKRTTANNTSFSPSFSSTTHYCGSSNVTYNFYKFPSPDSLAAASEDDLRSLGMGYRAKYIKESSRLVMSKPGGDKWFEQLRQMNAIDSTANRLTVQAALLEFPGVGRKVADWYYLLLLLLLLSALFYYYYYY